ncbi:hypothetical protein SALBM311S_12387 [Streptomyces alboniger]
MNPCSSRSTAPSSQSVSGAAPMNTNIHCASTSSVRPLSTSRSVSCSRCSEPCAASTTVPQRTEMFGDSSICWIR